MPYKKLKKIISSSPDLLFGGPLVDAAKAIKAKKNPLDVAKGTPWGARAKYIYGTERAWPLTMAETAVASIPTGPTGLAYSTLNYRLGKKLMASGSDSTLAGDMLKRIGEKPPVKIAGYAPGIPDKANYETPKTFHKPQLWEGAVQKHDALKAGPHLDLRLADPRTGKAYSWALRSIPNPGGKTLAVLQPVHDIKYLDFKGEIKSGYGAGKVSQAFRGKVEVLKSEPNKITFVVYDGVKTTRYSLINPSGFDRKDWLLVNHTPSKAMKSYAKIPSSKPKYKSLKVSDLDPKSEDSWSPKIDGAHSLFVLRKNKPIDVYSYRPSKKPNKIIDHSYKTDLYKHLSPESSGSLTVLRGELFGVNSKNKVVKSQETAGLLNSGTLRSRETQRAKNIRLDSRIFDVDYYKNKDVSQLPYKEKIKIIKEITARTPGLKPIEYHTTPAEKAKLLRDILSKKHPLTEEGIIVYNNKEAIPRKSKLVKDTEIYIHGFFAPEKNSRLQGVGVGGFYGSLSKNGTDKIRVGSGLTDQMRGDMLNNPNKYLNKPAKITYTQRLSSGKLFQPVFKEMRTAW